MYSKLCLDVNLLCVEVKRGRGSEGAEGWHADVIAWGKCFSAFAHVLNGSCHLPSGWRQQARRLPFPSSGQKTHIISNHRWLLWQAATAVSPETLLTAAYTRSLISYSTPHCCGWASLACTDSPKACDWPSTGFSCAFAAHRWQWSPVISCLTSCHPIQSPSSSEGLAPSHHMSIMLSCTAPGYVKCTLAQLSHCHGGNKWNKYILRMD